MVAQMENLFYPQKERDLVFRSTANPDTPSNNISCLKERPVSCSKRGRQFFVVFYLLLLLLYNLRYLH